MNSRNLNRNVTRLSSLNNNNNQREITSVERSYLMIVTPTQTMTLTNISRKSQPTVKTRSANKSQSQKPPQMTSLNPM